MPADGLVADLLVSMRETLDGRPELAASCAAILGAQPVERPTIMEREAFRLGRLVASGALGREGLTDALLHASGVLGTAAEDRARKGAVRSLERGIKRGASPERPEAQPPHERPVVRLGTDLVRVGDEAIAALCLDLDIYQRRGRLVHVVRVAATEKDAGRLEGAPEIRLLESPTLRERLSRVARFERYDGRSETWREATPTDGLCQAILRRGSWRGVRPLVGVTESPLLRPDGTILQRPGYDAATGYLYVPGCSFPEVPEHPTQADAMRALAELCEVWCDFPFRGEADRYVPIAALLTLMARPAIEGAIPGVVFDASTPGSGKSRMADTVAIIATGRGAPRAQYPEKPEELEKVLASAALAGRGLIGLDNVAAPLCGAALDAALTAEDELEIRILGRSELVRLPWRALVIATGNNVAVRGDTQRRVLVARLEPQVERPEDRTDFRHPDLVGWTREERTRLVCAALTVLRAFAHAGRPGCGLSRWGSYEAWCRWIPPAIVWAGGASVLDARLSVTGDVDPERAALSAVVRLWPRLDTMGRGLTLRSALALLYPAADRGGDGRTGGPPDGWEELREGIEVLCPPKPGQTPDAGRLGHAFRRLRGRVVAGGVLDAVMDRNGVQRWRVSTSGAPMPEEVRGM